jgi:hypothetical protein
MAQRHASPGDEPAPGEAYGVKAIVGLLPCLVKLHNDRIFKAKYKYSVK